MKKLNPHRTFSCITSLMLIGAILNPGHPAQASLTLVGSGNVAGLPAELRDQINQMFDDGVPYKAIIHRLGDAGKYLNEDNLTRWRQGGYQDYLNAQLLAERARAQTEAAADTARETGHADAATLQKVCNEIALLQYFETLMQHGGQLAQDSLRNNPAKLITLMNTLCKMTHATLAVEKNRDKAEAAAAASRARTHPHRSEP